MTDSEKGRGESGRRRRQRERYDPRAMRWVSGLAVLAGLWIAASPFVYASTPAAVWNNVLVGLAVVLVAGASFLHPSDLAVTNLGAVIALALLGLWTVLAPLVVAFGNPSLAWSTVGTGGLLALVSTYHAHAIRTARSGGVGVGP